MANGEPTEATHTKAGDVDQLGAEADTSAGPHRRASAWKADAHHQVEGEPCGYTCRTPRAWIERGGPL